METIENLENFKDYLTEEDKCKLDKMQEEIIEICKKEKFVLSEQRLKEIELLKQRLKQQYKKVK